jgi:hypothetical protein
VSPAGEVMKHFSSGVKPDSEEMRAAIEAALPATQS